MPKSAAQKARRRERRKFARGITGPAMMRSRGPNGPVVQPQSGKRKRSRGRKQQSVGNGLGLRSTQAPVSAALGVLTGEPRFLGRTAKSCRIAHRELVTSVTGSVAFTVQNSLALNPGIPTTFPWLAVEAQGWEQYKFNRLRFCYYSRCATSTPGSIMLVPDYDAADAAPSSEQIASSYSDTSEYVPWKEVFCCELDPKALTDAGDRKFVRTGTLAANLDIKTYDGGNLHLCTVDGTAVSWGKLWVEYDVEFFKPQLPPTGSSFNSNAKVVGSGSVSKTAYLGTSATVTGGLSVTGVTNTLTFANTGQFIVVVSLTGTALNGNATITGTASTVLLDEETAGGAVTAIIAAYTVVVTAVGQTVILDWSGVTSTVSASTVRIAPYPVSLA